MHDLIDISKALREQRRQLDQARRETVVYSRSAPESDLKAAATEQLRKVDAAIASLDEALKHLGSPQGIR